MHDKDVKEKSLLTYKGRVVPVRARLISFVSHFGMIRLLLSFKDESVVICYNGIYLMDASGSVLFGVV